jgi:hypothetical protein
MKLQDSFIEIVNNKHAQASYLPDQQIVLLKLLTSYVPFEDFKQVLEQVEDFAAREKVSAMILDKSSLRIFNQPSMEWYYITWKERMLDKGLKTYRKILPQDRLFEESVKIGRERIIRENPGFDISKFDIQYCKNIEEALHSIQE